MRVVLCDTMLILFVPTRRCHCVSPEGVASSQPLLFWADPWIMMLQGCSCGCGALYQGPGRSRGATKTIVGSVLLAAYFRGIIGILNWRCANFFGNICHTLFNCCQGKTLNFPFSRYS